MSQHRVTNVLHISAQLNKTEKLNWTMKLNIKEWKQQIKQVICVSAVFKLCSINAEVADT